MDAVGAKPAPPAAVVDTDTSSAEPVAPDLEGCDGEAGEVGTAPELVQTGGTASDT